MSLPYMPLYVDDYEADTAHLSLVEDGVYSRLLRLCWRSPKCQLPNDMDWIARKIRVSNDDERRALEAVIDEFFTVKRGGIFSKRLSAEHARISATVQKRKKAGKLGGRSKSLKSNEMKSGNARAMLKQPEPEPEPEKPNGFYRRAGARKPNGFVKPRTTTDAVLDFLQELNHDEGRDREGGEDAGSDVPMLPAVRAS